jgi:16S rRNA (uracil1498-N3)-methyltransferase
MTKIRIYLNQKFFLDKPIPLSDQQFHYLKRVMRLEENDKFFIFNKEEEWLAKFSFKKKPSAFPIEFLRISDACPDIWLCFSLIKSKNLSYLIEKVSEIGVRRIVPIITSFSENFKLNYERLNKIIFEAVEQNDSLNIPELTKQVKLSDLMKNWDSERLILFCDEKRKGQRILDLPLKKKKIAIFIGPVGGWSSEDKNLFKNKNFYEIELGPNILKADTASIVALSAVRNLL